MILIQKDDKMMKIHR